MKFSLSTLSFDCESPINMESVDDDFKREAAFARQALETVVKARKVIIAAKIPFTRPEGYFCEMLKTEEQMNSIAKTKQDEKVTAKAIEDARKQRLNRKLGKKIQVEKETEKQQQRSQALKKINEATKRKRPAIARADDEFGVDIVDDDGKGASSSKNGQKSDFSGKRSKTMVSKKRQARNETYGFGGKKRGIKRNDKKSVDADNFDVNKNRRAFKGTNIGARKTKKNTQRPGKQRREQMRSKKNSRK